MLHINVHMRSNDAWRGFAYDVIMVWVLACVMQAELKCDSYRINWCADSMHIYDDTRTAVRNAIIGGSERWQEKTVSMKRSILPDFEDDLRAMSYKETRSYVHDLVCNDNMRGPFLPWHFMFSAITDRYNKKREQAC